LFIIWVFLFSMRSSDGSQHSSQLSFITGETGSRRALFAVAAAAAAGAGSRPTPVNVAATTPAHVTPGTTSSALAAADPAPAQAEASATLPTTVPEVAADIEAATRRRNPHVHFSFAHLSIVNNYLLKNA
jgi:hypothetical protein